MESQPIRKRQKVRSGIKARGYFILASAAIITVLLVVFAYQYISSRTFKDTVNTVVSRSDTPAKAFPGKDEVNILLMGRDLDRDNHGRIVKTRGRTDAMMLVHINFKENTCNILSIPRDTLVHIPGYTGKRRVSYANQFGGTDLAQETIKDFLGVEPDYYLLVNFKGFENAIDSIGGLKIDVDKQLDYDDDWGNLHIHLKPGEKVLNGNQAMGFVRFRKDNTGHSDSDLIRITRQQKLMMALKDRMGNPGVMFTVPKLLDKLREDMDGNLTPAQMVCLARFMKSLPSSARINMKTVPALDCGGVYVRADLDATNELVRQMFFDN